MLLKTLLCLGAVAALASETTPQAIEAAPQAIDLHRRRSVSSSRIGSRQVPGHPHHHHHGYGHQHGHQHRHKPCHRKPCHKESSSSSDHRPCCKPSSSSSSSSSCGHHHRPRGCNEQQLQSAAIALTRQYQARISACEFGQAEALATLMAQARTSAPDCANGTTCCTTVSSLSAFFMRFYGMCNWDVTWLNQVPMTAQVKPDGSVVVTAVQVAVFRANPTIISTTQVELTWAPQNGFQGGQQNMPQNCRLKLTNLKSRDNRCGELGLPNCNTCQLLP